MEIMRSSSTTDTSRRRNPDALATDTFSLGKPWRPRRWPYALVASAVAASMVAASAVGHGMAPRRGVALQLVSDQSVRPSSPLHRHVQLGHFGGVQERAVWVTTPSGAAGSPAGSAGVSGSGFAPSSQGGASTAGQAPTALGGAAGSGSASSGSTSSVAGSGIALAPVAPVPVAPAAPVASATVTPSPSLSASPTGSPSATPSASGSTSGTDLSQWVAECDVGDPGTGPGTAAWNVYWQHHAEPAASAFPIDQMNYPCGPGWIIIPGSDPFTPPVWNGVDAPFAPPTNMDGGQMFTAAGDATAQQLSSELSAAGVPISDSGQLLGYGADGAPIHVTAWWTLTPDVKNAAAAIMFKHDAYPHPMWRTDAYHWGYGNIGVGLPT
ncbi:MAG: hypothetical protein M3Q23_15775 [Actinomycetota bacterium]|nr:hypothetical protein [Actinomycetota bacterium]